MSVKDLNALQTGDRVRWSRAFWQPELDSPIDAHKAYARRQLSKRGIIRDILTINDPIIASVEWSATDREIVCLSVLEDLFPSRTLKPTVETFIPKGKTVIIIQEQIEKILAEHYNLSTDRANLIIRRDGENYSVTAEILKI